MFFPVSVFDIAQSDLIEGHEDPTALAAPLNGADDAHTLIEALVLQP